MDRYLRNSVLLLVIITAAIGGLSGCSPRDLVSTSDEIAVGRQAAAEVEATYPVSRNAAHIQLVNQIGNTILRNVPNPRSGIEYTFRVLDVDDVNAFALPGGWIYINRGLIEATGGNRNQLAGVIAHEIAHVEDRHAAEMMGRSQIYGIAIGVLTEGNATQWASIFANLNLLRWSRRHEYESDRLAIDYLLPSTYNPEGLITFLEYLLAEQGRGRTPAFLRTHPLTQDRIDRLQDYLDQERAS